MLTAMLIAQELNQDNVPIYGGFLFGPYWQFAILDGRTYLNSQDFNATNPNDLLKIIPTQCTSGDLVLMMGAGSITYDANTLSERLHIQEAA